MENAAKDVDVDPQEMLQLQLSEVEMLFSMFPNPGELVLDDPMCVPEIQNFVDGSIPYDAINCRIGFTVKVNASEDDKNVAEMVCHLPHEYPAVPPKIFIRAPFLVKQQTKLLSEDLQNFILEQDRNEIILTAVIQWLQDNIKSYESVEPSVESPSKKKPTTSQIKDTKFSRMWIYSHHIYSKIKRKDLLELSSELNLTGFTLPGKPGIIVVEGYSHLVEEFWGTVRRWQWKKITMKEKEDYDIGDKTIDDLRKFSNYEEKNFDARGGRGREVHMNLGALFNYLEERGCGHIFPLYFGVDGKSQTEND